MIILKRDRRTPVGGDYILHVCGLELRFQRRTLQGQQVVAAIVPDGHPECATLRERFAGQPDLWDIAYGIDDDDLLDEPNEQPVDFGRAALSPVIAAALSAGWSVNDLLGAGENDEPGLKGGRSSTTGLTMAQMAMASPPPNWRDVCEVAWPWDVEGWTPPGLNFKAPDLPPKAVLRDIETGEVVKPPEDGSPILARVVPDIPEAPRLTQPTEPEKPKPEPKDREPEPEPDAPTPKPEAPKASTGDDPDSDEPEQDGLPWSDEAITAAVACIRGMVEESGKPPSHAKAGHRLRKIDGIETVSKEDFALLLDMV